MNPRTFLLVWLIVISAQPIVGSGALTAQTQGSLRTTRQLAQRRESRRNRLRPGRDVGTASATRKTKTTRVQVGDTLVTVAARLKVSVNELAKLNSLKVDSKLRRGERLIIPNRAGTASPPATQSQKAVIGKRITFTDGTTIEADNVWKQGNDLWYTRGGISNQTARPVRSVEPLFEDGAENAGVPAVLQPLESKLKDKPAQGFLIYLVGGARVRADEIKESVTGTWYRRDNLSILLERERIARIEREPTDSKRTGWTERGWTSGNAGIDELIRSNATRFSLDPYLVFCVIEHESHFHVRAVSPKGALGLMQLMPATASRFGVRRPFDPAQNIFGGTQYLKELLQTFGGRLDLALASYNAGEAAVIKYGRTVPPYRETRDYVKRVTRRYGGNPRNSAETITPSPR